MSRSLSAALRAALNAQETGEVILTLVTLAHPDIVTQRFVNDHNDIVSRGETFVRFPFDVTIPDDRDDEVVRVKLTIDNVERSVVLAILSITTPAVFTIEIIRAAAPDVVEAGPFACVLRNVSWDGLTVSGDLTFEDLLNLTYPRYAFTPDLFPGLFA